MTADEIKTTVKRHRRAAFIGGLAGLLLLVGWIAYDFSMTPLRPDLHTAKAAQIVAYIGDERGLPTLPQIEEHQFLLQWRDIVMQDHEKREELKACFTHLDKPQRKVFSEAIFKYFKRAFIDDAKRYARTPADQKYDFLHKKTAEYREQALFMKEVAVGFKDQVSGRQDDLQKWIMEHTTAEDRAIGEPYFDALKRVREQVKKQQRAPASAPAQTSKPTP